MARGLQGALSHVGALLVVVGPGEGEGGEGSEDEGGEGDLHGAESEEWRLRRVSGLGYLGQGEAGRSEGMMFGLKRNE